MWFGLILQEALLDPSLLLTPSTFVRFSPDHEYEERLSQPDSSQSAQRAGGKVLYESLKLTNDVCSLMLSNPAWYEGTTVSNTVIRNITALSVSSHCPPSPLFFFPFPVCRCLLPVI